jgi:dipeptidyl aminopeptidase/acylaminoacyl peptidase
MTSSPLQACAPYGAWPSPITAAVVAAGAAPLSQSAIDDQDVIWVAGRASEGGRNTLLRLRKGEITELTPAHLVSDSGAPFNVRSRVHEYGGGALLADRGVIVFSHFADNRLYVLRDGAVPLPITAAGPRRYADFVHDAARQRLITVCEDHASGGYPDNYLAAVGFDGSQTTLAAGADFYAAPRLSPDGSQLAWLSWMHPRMPWEGTQLWLADLAADGSVQNARLVAGGADESICQPEWSPGGVLHFVSDRSGWWNLYRLDGQATTALCPRDAEFGGPHWTFGNAMYGFSSESSIVCSYIENGVSHLARLSAGVLTPIDTPYQEIRELRVAGDVIVFFGGAPTIASQLVRMDLGSSASSASSVLAQSIASLPERGNLSVPSGISYPSAGGRTAYAFYYPPQNAHYQADPAAGEKPPLMVIGHGGPTSMAANTLKLATQYWTSRGFAVLDVNYGGSTGFGRAYRNALKGQWGVMDVDDCVAGARYLAEQGLVDANRLVIRGGSAGGLTVLCALAFHDVFKAGASYYGVSDLAGLDADSHKFEAQYTAWLIAPQPQAAQLYRERSPIHHADKLKSPMIFFQGLDDKVVPPPQSEVMVEALRRAGVPVAYMTLEGEGHGFRKADSIVRTLEAELAFYLRIFGVTPAEPLPALRIENLPDAA